MNLFLILVLLVAWLCPVQVAVAASVSTENPGRNDIRLIINEVIKRPDLSTINGLALVLRESVGSATPFGGNDSSNCALEEFLVDDDALIRLIEDKHHLLFDDYLQKAPEAIRVEFQAPRTEGVSVGTRQFQRIAAVKAVKFEGDSEWQLYSDFNPPHPVADANHHYVEVPISYSHPEQGKFRLYYEVNGDFDKSKPVVMIPTDAQRDSCQVGMADKYRKIFDLSCNVVTYDYRGQFCSAIPDFQKRGWSWKQAYSAFSMDNAVEDIEAIRQDLVGDGKIYLLGGSGMSMLGLKYLSKYHQHVSKAFLMSFFKDAAGGSRSGVEYFNAFLKNNNLLEQYSQIRKKKTVPLDQLLFLLQRLLYSDEEGAKKLIVDTDSGDLSLFYEESKKQGGVDFFVRFPQKYSPQAVVFMHETNIPTSSTGEPDINSPFLQIGEPLDALEKFGEIPVSRFEITRLEKIDTEVLLIAGTLDQVAPIGEMRRIRALMPQAKMAVFKSYHCLMDKESRDCRNGLIETFFHHGMAAPEFTAYLHSDKFKDLFVGLE
ncbi:MAG: alpha/beta fold hydrolase [Alphaproteobacteria bacterium]|nr:alpha/beta fold hydrolase [Alphaproteobacteria bacterium]